MVVFRIARDDTRASLGMTALDRAYFYLARGVGRFLRAGTYSRVQVVDRDDRLTVRKRRSFYAPLLIALGDGVVRLLDTGMRVLPQREWEQRERGIYEGLYGASIRVEPAGTLVLPHLAGRPLASLLDDTTLGRPGRQKAVELAVAALADLHASGLTHGDAMAENVMVDLDTGTARWFDFETVHDENRPVAWRRADDVRALLATSLLRTRREDLAETLQLVVGGYADDAVTSLLAASFASVLRRPLAFHLGQAGLSFERYREIGRLLTGR